MATWTHVQGTGNDSSGTVSSIASTFGSSVTAGNLIVVGVAMFSVIPTTTLADSKGNTYTRAIRFTFGTTAQTIDIWYSLAAFGGTSNAVTATFGTANYANISIDEYSFTSGGAAALDATAHGEIASSGTVTYSLSVTGTGPDLMYGVATSTNSDLLTFSAGSGFTLRHSHAFNSGSTVGFAAEDKLDVTATQNVVFVASTNATNVQSAAVSFIWTASSDVAPLLPAM